MTYLLIFWVIAPIFIIMMIHNSLKSDDEEELSDLY